MIDQYDLLLAVDEDLRKLLELELEDLHKKIKDMIDSISLVSVIQNDQRSAMIYLLERIQRLDKEIDPNEPFGREDYQMLFDAALRVLEEAAGESGHQIVETFGRHAQIRQLSPDRLFKPSHAIPQVELQQRLQQRTWPKPAAPQQQAQGLSVMTPDSLFIR